MWSFCKRASGLQQAAKPEVDLSASCEVLGTVLFWSNWTAIPALKKYIKQNKHNHKPQFVTKIPLKVFYLPSLGRKLQQCMEWNESNSTEEETSCQAERESRLTQFVWKKIPDTSGKKNSTWILPFKEFLELIFHAMYRELCNHRLFTYPALVRNKGQMWLKSHSQLQNNCFPEGQITNRKASI